MTDSTEPAGYGHAEALAHAARETIATMSIADYLAALGGTPAAIADTLRRLEITGQQGISDSCPIAVYLREHTPTGWVAVSASSIALDDADPITTPLPVAMFVRAFDQGMYPDLITPAAPRDDDL